MREMGMVESFPVQRDTWPNSCMYDFSFKVNMFRNLPFIDMNSGIVKFDTSDNASSEEYEDEDKPVRKFVFNAAALAEAKRRRV